MNQEVNQSIHELKSNYAASALERVGKKEEQPKEPSPPRVRSKRKMESCPFCVRSFTDKENLKEHMRSDHFDS